MLTGFPCPGCGITKSIIFFYKGDIISSLGQHIFGIGVALAAVYYLIWLAFKFLTGVSILPAILKNRALGYGLGALLGVYHLGRLVVFIMQHSIDQILRESVWM